MRISRIIPMAAITLACATRHATPLASAVRSPSVDVRLEPDEAHAAVAILSARLAGRTPAESLWQRLFASAGYRHLAERQASIGHALDDSAFAAWLRSDSALTMAPALDSTVSALEHVSVEAPAARALSYLPAGTPLRATLYLEVKHATNSFVFTGADSVRSIFLAVHPHETPAQLENTLAHELHHIGLEAACPEPALARATPAQRMLLRFLGAFGEGEAMLAAAGSPAVHPHAADDDSIRQRWDRDVSRAPEDMRELSAFFGAVLDGRIASPDSVRDHALTYYGVQGPWYTVGWLMASTVERELGRPALIGVLCEPTQLLARYNDAAARANPKGAHLPLWDAALVNGLVRLRRAAE